jgi:hypothetical protein
MYILNLFTIPQRVHLADGKYAENAEREDSTQSERCALSALRF